MARMSSGELKRAIGRIQRLCLGGSGQPLVPSLVEEYKRAIPYRTCGFLWAGQNQKLVNAYTDEAASLIMASYLDKYQNDDKSEVFRSFGERMRTNYATPTGDWLERVLRVDLRQYYRSDLYNMIFRPMAADKGLTVKIAEHGRPLAALTLFRRTHDPDFTTADNHLLDATAPFVAHALQDAPGRGGYAPGGDHALLIVKRNGVIQHLSPQARRLLLMALFPQWMPGMEKAMLRPVPEIVQLCERLTVAESGAVARAPPVWRERNAWGEFVLRAHWLETVDFAQPCELIGITIERLEPRAVALVRRIESLPLSQREKRICFLLASDRTRSEIAAFVGVSEHTVIAQQRSIYAKIGANNRAGLREYLSDCPGIESERLDC